MAESAYSVMQAVEVVQFVGTCIIINCQSVNLAFYSGNGKPVIVWPNLVLARAVCFAVAGIKNIYKIHIAIVIIVVDGEIHIFVH